MKKIYYILLSLILLIPAAASAAGAASMSVPSSAENGSNVTAKVTVSGVAAWNVKITGSGATSGCSSVFADVTIDAKNTTKTFSVTCRATKEGTITFTATGDITSQDGANSAVSITKNVNIVKARERDTESRLSSLTIENKEIDFDKDTTNYTVEVDYKVESLNVNANALSDKARVTINNPEYLKFGENTITVVVTSESGAEKVYTINVLKKEPVLDEEDCVVPETPECTDINCECNNTPYIITIVLESIVLVSLLGYIIYDKKIKK
ncbi:MAG: cadherin-like beta sandwich domain-containing protein [Bacilli bacterium]|nr:cadherin-like beta sandwich domain-containing protein [Bacilli bacterium]